MKHKKPQKPDYVIIVHNEDGSSRVIEGHKKPATPKSKSKRPRRRDSA